MFHVIAMEHVEHEDCTRTSHTHMLDLARASLVLNSFQILIKKNGWSMNKTKPISAEK